MRYVVCDTNGWYFSFFKSSQCFVRSFELAMQFNTQNEAYEMIRRLEAIYTDGVLSVEEV